MHVSVPHTSSLGHTVFAAPFTFFTHPPLSSAEADEHFSADELGVRATTQAFFALQCINVMGIVVIRSKLVHRKKFHWTVFILMCCIGMTFLSNCLALSHYTTYASDGIGAPRVLVVSQYVRERSEHVSSTSEVRPLFSELNQPTRSIYTLTLCSLARPELSPPPCSHMCVALARRSFTHTHARFARRYIKLATDALFTLLLLLLAKGWTIVRRKISPDGRVKLAMFVTVQTCLSIFAVTWSQYSYDIAEVTYFYESAPGVMLCVLRVAGALWFLRAAQTTANNFEKKRGFYGKFNKFFFSYMLIVPVAVALATAAETYYRFMLVYGVETAATWFGQTLLMLLYNPSTQFNRSFPFHSHTSSMLGMYGKSKDNTKASTLMVSSNRNNRLQQGPQSPGAPPPLVATPNVLQSQYRAAATNSTINTVSGGLGVQKSRAGQVVVTNQFDADHFLRIKDASDIIRGELRELVERAEKLDRVLDAVTIENASSYGVLGDRYLRGQAEKESQKRIALEATARTNQYAVANPNGLSGSLPKKIGRRSGAGGGTDWMKGIENVDAAGDSKVLEMVTRVGGSSASALAKSIDAEKEKRENEKELLKKPSMPVVENKKKAVEEEEKKKLEKGPEPGVEEYKAAPEEEVKEERGEMPQTSPAMPNPDEDSEDEFDRAFSAAPAKPAAEKKVPPKGPPPGKPPSRSGSRQTSRENSPRTSRQSSRDNSPRAGDSSRDASPRPGGDGGDAKEGEQEKKVKKKKVKKEKRRGSKDLPAVSRGGSKENSARIEYHN